MRLEKDFRTVTKGLYPGKYNRKIYGWLQSRYGSARAEKIWKDVQANYVKNYADLPDLGGKKNGHSSAIYGGLLIFSLYPALPDRPPVSQLQNFVQELFFTPFAVLGKVIDLNRKSNMKLIDRVFRKTGDKDRKDIRKYPAGFCNVACPYDSENRVSRYSFTQCPNAEFAKKHDLLHVLPLLCNSDFYGISALHGILIRKSTCGNGMICDYCVMGDRNPMAKEYETVTDEGGFLVSRKKEN